MFTYSIKENGYSIGSAKGKHKAIQRIKQLNIEGDWSQDYSGNIIFTTQDARVYSIEQES